MVYLDYAATSAIRPEPVIDAVAAYLRDIGATPGRSGHRLAVAASRMVFRCRSALAELFGVEGDPGRIAFQPNATHALNTALWGILQPGDHVVCTQYDHNAVRRSITALTTRGVSHTVLAGRPDGGIDLDELDAALVHGGRRARVLVMSHASNVLGSVLPVTVMAQRAHAVGAIVVLDAAQTAGHLPVDVRQLGVDLLAFTGHKGLLGPQGIGGLWVREGIQLEPLFYGGTGSDSEQLEMPAAYPDRLEAGTQNGPGIAGLLAGVQWLQRETIRRLHDREQALKADLRARLVHIPDLRVLSPPAPDGVGIVLVSSDRHTSAELALRLDREHDVLVRAGLHCAPGAHEVLGTVQSGAARFSIGWATTQTDIERAAEALALICSLEPVGV